MMTVYDIILLYQSLVDNYIHQKNSTILINENEEDLKDLKEQAIKELEETINNFKNTKVKFSE